MSKEKLLLKENEIELAEEKQPVCGIIMPISPIDSYPETHWGDVLGFIKETILEAGFKADLVSKSDEVSVIQKTIVQNIYTSDIVVCDVSALNPNVMFELGMRLTFDKPTVIITDNATKFIFDTGIIEHLIYPKDLRLTTMRKFKDQLIQKIKHTYQASIANDKYSPFLQNFGKFTVSKLAEKEISEGEFIVKSLAEMKKQISSLNEKIALNPIADIAIPTRDHGNVNVAVGLTRSYLRNELKNNPEISRDELFSNGLKYITKKMSMPQTLAMDIVATVLNNIGKEDGLFS